MEFILIFAISAVALPLLAKKIGTMEGKNEKEVQILEKETSKKIARMRNTYIIIILASILITVILFSLYFLL